MFSNIKLTDKPSLEVLLFDELAQPLFVVQQYAPYGDLKYFDLSQQPKRGKECEG